MFPDSLKLSALAISPFVLCSAGCTNSPATAVGNDDAGAPTVATLDGSTVSEAAAPRDRGADSGTPMVDAGVASDDSGIVPDDAPPGCPPVSAAPTAGSPVGTLLAAGNALSARGVTSDGYEIFSDDAALQLYAIPIGGGTRQSIVALGSKFWVTVVGQVVFAWSNVTAANVGALTIWSSAHGAHLISSASFGILGASSADGSQILYVSNVDAGGATGDVYLSDADGTGATALLQGQQLGGCFPQLGFAGAYAVASHCDVARGTGPSSTVSSFHSPSWTRTDLATGAENTWSADAAGTMVLVSAGNGVLVVPIGGGAGTMIDPEGFLAQLIAGGQTAVYSTTGGQLRSSPTTAPSPLTLATSFGGFYSVSPDQTRVLYYVNSTSSGTDVYLASTLSAGTSRALSTATTGTVNGDAFTADSTYALYSSGQDVCTGASAFSAYSVSGTAPVALGHNVWGDWGATGSKVIFNDNYVATGAPTSNR